MVVYIVRAVPHQLRGTMSKWAIEPAPGVFIGDLSAIVRDQLWHLLQQDTEVGSATMIHSSDDPSGYTVRTSGVADRRLVDLDGVQLVARRYLRDRTLKTENSPT